MFATQTTLELAEAPMIEIPEATTLAKQVREHMTGKTIHSVVSGSTPHKLAWFFGTQDDYQKQAEGRTVTNARAVGGMLEIEAEDAILLFGEGVNPRLFQPGESKPSKHQFLVEFGDHSYLVCRVQMYGGMGVFKPGECSNEYYLIAGARPAVPGEEFNRDYFESILTAPGAEKLSAKALLATEQRIPGLGNGVLQDILFNACVNPRIKTGELDGETRDALFTSVKKTIRAMIDGGGRDTESDLFGNPGGYQSLMSRNTVGTPCPECGEPIQKASYLGGSVYYCPRCQPV